MHGMDQVWRPFYEREMRFCLNCPSVVDLLPLLRGYSHCLGQILVAVAAL